MTTDFDPYHKWLGIPPHEQPANHYRLLGISLFEADADVIEHAADRQMSHLRTHTNGPNAAHSQKLLNEISAAKLCLLNAVKRGEYDAQLQARLAPPPPAAPQPVYTQPVYSQPVPMQPSAQYAPVPVYAPQYPQPQYAASPPYAAQPYAAQPAYAPQAYAPAALAAVAEERPAAEAEESFLDGGAVATSSASRRRGRRGDIPLWVKLAGQVVASIVGLGGGYAILCWIGPQYDFLGLMKQPAEVASAPSTGDTGKTASPANSATTQPPANGPSSKSKKPSKPPGEEPGSDSAVSSSGKSGDNGASTKTSSSAATEAVSSDSFDLLKLSDPKRDSVRGEWKLSGGVLDSPRSLAQGRMELKSPVSLGTQYELTVVATRQANGGPGKSLAMGLLSEGKQFLVMLDTNGKDSGIDNVDGKFYLDNSSTHRGPVFKDGVPAKVVYTVGPRHVRVTVDGEQIIDWSGELASLGVQDIWRTPHADWLFIGCDSTYRFSQVTLRPLKGLPSSSVRSPTVASVSKPVAPKKPAKKRQPPRILGDLLEPKPKKSEPDAADRKTAEKQLREEYKDDFAKSKKDFAEQAKLAKKLLDRVRGSTGKPAEVYAGLDLAIELAGSAGDLRVGGEAVDELGGQFKGVDVLARKEEMMKDAVKRAKTPDDLKTVAEAYRLMLNRAIQEDRYDAAVKFGTKAVEFARKSKDDVFVKLLADGVKELKVMQAAYDEVRASREKLERNTDDAEACRQWGRFLCVYKNDWENGLALWCQAGESDPLAALAGEDLDAPKSAADQAALADGWWQAAEDEPAALPQRMLRDRAMRWYRLALPALSAAEKSRVEARLKEQDEANSAFPRGKWVDVLQLVDLNRHKSAGAWARRGDEIGIKDAPDNARFTVPVAPTGSYDLEVHFTILKNHDVLAVLPVGGRQGVVLLNGWSGTVSGIGNLRGAGEIRDNSTAFKHKRLALNQRHRMLIHVESGKGNADIQVTLNDQPWVKYNGPADALSLHANWSLARSNVVGLGTYRADLVFHSARLRINSGSAQLIPD